MRFVVSALSLCFIVLLVCVGGAEFAYQQGKAGQNAALIRMAERINPLVSDYAYEDYRVTGDLGALRRALRLEPTRPAYHMYYGLALLQSKPRTRLGDREAVTEICKAARLKPYSKEYKAACEQYKKAIPIPEAGVLR
jgi:hypothetical protein